MGTSTNAMLIYGYDFEPDAFEGTDKYGELPDLDWYDDESDEGFADQAMVKLLAEAGITVAEEDYWEARWEAEKHLGLTVQTHCCQEAEMEVLAAKVITARRGWLEPIVPEVLAGWVEEGGWDDKLNAAMATLSLTPKAGRPQWLLCSWWG